MTNSPNAVPLLFIAAMTLGLAGSAMSMQARIPAATNIAVVSSSAVASASPVVNSSPARPLAGRTILIDPGHGGKDPGAMRAGVEEKNITLSVALDLRSRLQALGAKVVLTRDVDTAVPLLERLADSNSLCPDIFLSIHANSIKDSRITGIETYYFDARGEKLSVDVLDTLAGHLHQSARWSHARHLRVLDGNRAPAVLAEIGYITNPSSRAHLASGPYQNEVAAGLADALVAYFQTPGLPDGCQA